MLSSEQNSRIKNIIKLLEKSKERKKQKKFVVEGVQENTFALDCGYKPLEYYLNEDIYQQSILLPKSITITLVSENVYNKIAYRKTTEGIIGIYEYPIFLLDQLKIKENTLFLALEGIEKPGNLGAILRSSDALGVDAVILLNEKVDFFNPNVIRSSVGTVFTVPIYSVSSEIFYEFCLKNAIFTYGTFMDKQTESIRNIKFNKKLTLLFGTESTGLTEFWRDKISKNFTIPMQGKVDSLNISNAVAISLFEATKDF